ncbi:MAG: NADH:ubiquinone reductase (Na(+)-transporting) subunit F [Endomicrobiia bacterium]
MIQVVLMNLILVIITVLLVVADSLLVKYGECKIVINKEKTIHVTGGEYLLSSLVSNKIYIPSACGGKATCGHCKIKVLSGAGSILPTEEVFITRQERNSGLRLACQVKIKGIVEIYIPEYLLETQQYTGIVVKKENLTHDIKYIKINLQSPNTIKFKPGQYIQLKIPGTDEFRAYSIASAPYDANTIELIVRLVPGGLCSTYVHSVLEVGDKVTFTGPFGEFFLREESSKDIICIGGGCGMAPIRSILYYLKEHNMPRKVIYFFGARAKRDLFYTEELKELERKYPNFKYIPALSEPKADDRWEGETGLITQVVERYVHDASNSEAYLCGPPPMIEAAIKVLTKKGIKQENIYYDKF